MSNWDGFQALAWLTWRHRDAVAYFTGEAAERRWKRAKNGKWPKRLGPTLLTPRAAEQELIRAMQSGDLPFTMVSQETGHA